MILGLEWTGWLFIGLTCVAPMFAQAAWYLRARRHYRGPRP